MGFQDSYSDHLRRQTARDVDAWIAQRLGAEPDDKAPGPEKYRPLVERLAPEYGQDPRLILAMMTQESQGNAQAVSPKGAIGLMQLIPATARRFGVADPYNPEQNIRGSMRYMQYLQRLYPGRIDLQLASYNAGEGAVKKYGNAIPPYPETQNYVARITANYYGTQEYQSRAPQFDEMSPEQRQTARGAVQSLMAPRPTANQAQPSTLQQGMTVDVRPRMPMRPATEEQAAVFEGTYTPPRVIEGPAGILDAQRQPVGRVYSPMGSELEEPLLQRLPAQAAQGLLSAAAGGLAALPAFERIIGIETPFGNTAQDLSQSLRSAAQSFEPSGEDTVIDRFAETLGGQALFFGAGVAAEVGRRALFTAVPRVATALGLGTPALVSTVMEAATEAGDTYDTLTPLVGQDEAASRANSVFWRNAVAIGLTNRLGIFNPAQTGTLGKVVASGALEGVQEVVQYDIQRRQFTVPGDHPQAKVLEAQGWQRDEASGQLRMPFEVATAAEAFVIGGLLGGAAGGLMQELATTLPEDPAQTAKLPEFRSWASAISNERGSVAMPFGPSQQPQAQQADEAPTIRRGAGIPTDRLRDEKGRWRIPLRDIPPTELELKDFIRQQGGINLAQETDVPGELRALIHPKETGTTGLMNNVRGVSLQRMAEKAAELNFTPAADKTALLEALERSVRGQAVYSQQAIGSVPYFENPNVTMAYEAFLGIADTLQQRTEVQRRGTRPRALAHEEALEKMAQGEWTREDIEMIAEGTVLNDTDTVAVIRNLHQLVKALQRATVIHLNSGGGAGTPEALAVMQIAGMYGELSPIRSGLSAEASRSLGIHNDPLSGMNEMLRAVDRAILQAPDHSLETFSRRVSAIPDEATLTKSLMRQAKNGSIFEEFFYNGMLSSPRTLNNNLLDGFLNTVWAIPDRALAAVIGLRPGGEVQFRETTDMLWAFVHGQRSALQSAYHTFKRLEDTGLRESGWDTQEDAQSKYGGRDYRAATAENVGMDPNRWWGIAFDGWARYVGFASGGRLPTRLMITADEYIGMLNYGMEIHAAARRSVRDVPADQQALEMEKFLRNPPDGAVEAAQNAVRQRLYTQDLGKFMQKMQDLVNTPVSLAPLGWDIEVPAAKIILPFLRVGTNIARTMVDRTPAALVSKRFWSQVAGEDATGASADLAIAKALSGTMLLVTFAGLAMAGIVTGRGPEDPELRAAGQWAEREYSIKIGDKYVSYRRLGSLGMLLGLAADFVQLMGEGDLTAMEKATSGMLTIAARNIFSQTWMQGLERFFNAFTLQPGETTKGFGSGAHRFIQGLAAMPVPGLLASIERAIDPEIREVERILDLLFSRVPGWSRYLPARRNRWGEKKLLGWGFDTTWVNALYNAASPLEVRQATLAPIERELERQKIQVGMPSRLLALGADMTKPLEGQEFKPIRLNDKQYEEYVVLASANSKELRALGLQYPEADMAALKQVLEFVTLGTERPPEGPLALKDALNWLITTQTYREDRQPGATGGQARMIQQVVQAYTNMGRTLLLDLYPDLATRVDAARFEGARRRAPISLQSDIDAGIDEAQDARQEFRRQRPSPRIPVGGGS